MSMGAMAISQYRASSKLSSLLNREAQVASAESRVAAYGNDLKGVTVDLERRQTFLEQMGKMLPAGIKSGETVSDSSDEAAKMINKVSLAIPQAGALARIEARQLALVERMTRYADRRAARTEAAIRQLGLDPRAMLPLNATGLSIRGFSDSASAWPGWTPWNVAWPGFRRSCLLISA
jgi:hypothetical protein